MTDFIVETPTTKLHLKSSRYEDTEASTGRLLIGYRMVDKARGIQAGAPTQREAYDLAIREGERPTSR